MGSPETEEGRTSNETQHLVRITKPFYLSATEVTQAQYARVMGNNPSHTKVRTNRLKRLVGTTRWSFAES